MSYLDQVIKASGGYGAPVENLTSEKKKAPAGYHYMPDGTLMKDSEHSIRAALEAAGMLVPEEQDLADALLEIAEKYGKFNDDNTGVWAGYESAEENAENAAIGVKCGNCVFWEAPNGCKIIQATTEEGGLCRFAILPDGAVTADASDPCWDGYVQVGMKEKDGKMVPNCVPADEAALSATAGSKPAPKKDQIKGSDKNPKGSASGGKSVTFSKKVEAALQDKADKHNEKHGDTASRKTSLKTLKAVYRRGAGAFSTSHRPDQNRNSWAMARVNAFLHLLRTGKPKNSKYTTDNDLLPAAHPRSSKKDNATITAALYDAYIDSQLEVQLLTRDEYESVEHAIYSLAEYSGMGYDIIPSIRAAWLRGVKAGEDPFERATSLAIQLHNSQDSDLLPKEEI